MVFLVAALVALEFVDATPLSGLRNAQFDRYQRQMPRPRDEQPVIIVGIDSQSLVAHGQWPWSRDLIARLSSRILAGQPLALGFDIVFAERDHYSPAVLEKALPGLPRHALSALPDPDARFAEALASGPTVLAVIGLTNPLPGAGEPRKPLAALASGEPSEQWLNRFSSALVSRPELENASSSEAFINASPDPSRTSTERGVLRRVPSLAFIHGQPYLPLSLEMVRLALGEAGIVRAELGGKGMEGIRIGDYRLPTQANGDLLIRFGKASSNYYLSAADVLSGEHPAEIFRSRFVIVGFNSTGLQDSIVTPLGESVPGVDIHAQIIENLLAGTALKRPAWMPRLEQAALLLGGVLLIFAVPGLRPRFALLSYAGLATLLVGGGYLAFYLGQWLFDGPGVALVLAPVFIALLANTLVASDARRRRAELSLQESREAAARAAGQLDAARRIQMGLLPDPARLFANEKRFSVAALLEPALAVGGDFYDCFMLDNRHLCLVIGDVSGKGVPASLFMAIAKVLTGTLTRRERNLAQAIRDVEHELSRENPEYLFVTLFVAIVDADDGALEYVCAGHDAPLLLRQGQVEQIDTGIGSGPPLCATGDFTYRAGHFRLLPGDLLCLFTDGATEAGDGSRMFGKPGLMATLHALRERQLPALISGLRDEVRHFESGRPAADDLTLLLFHYDGPLPVTAGPATPAINAG